MRAQAPIEFPNAMVAADLRATLNDGIGRKVRRKEQKKVGESHHNHTFNNKLKSQSHGKSSVKNLHQLFQ